MTERLLGLLLLLMVPTAAGAQVRADAPGISPEAVQYRIGVLADDSMAGRDTPSPELEQAARWIAGELRPAAIIVAADVADSVWTRYQQRQSRPTSTRKTWSWGRSVCAADVRARTTMMEPRISAGPGSMPDPGSITSASPCTTPDGSPPPSQTTSVPKRREGPP
jgi:hypothetical protein